MFLTILFTWLNQLRSIEKKHLERCKLHGVQRIKLPEADDIKERNKRQAYKIRIPTTLIFCHYADFKSVLPKQDSCGPLSAKFFITQYQHQVPCESCIYVKCSDRQNFKPLQVNIGDDFAEKFLDLVLAAVFIWRQHLANNILMKSLTQEQWRQYKNATNCSICSKPYKSADKKVCDHDHLTGKYRGPAYNAWNFNYRLYAIFCLILQLFTLIFILVSNFLTLVSNMFLQICNFCFTHFFALVYLFSH